MKGKSKVLIGIISAIVFAIVSAVILNAVGLFKISKFTDSNSLEGMEDLAASVSIMTNAKTGYKYKESDTGEIVITDAGKTYNNGFCMFKGKRLIGKQDQLYNDGSAYGKHGGNNKAQVNVLFDNVILPFGSDGSDKTQKAFYKAKLGKLTDISNMSDWQIFEAEQYAFWHYTNGTSDPRSYALCKQLISTADNIVKNRSTLANLKGKTNVSISNTSAKISVSGTTWKIGPFNLNNPASEFFKLSMDNITFTENGKNSTISNFQIVNGSGKSVNGYSDYYGWNGQFYIKFTHNFSKNVNYNVKLNNLTALTYTTTVTNWTNGYLQPVATPTRKAHKSTLSFSKGYVVKEGSYQLKLIKKSMKQNDTVSTATHALASAKFSVEQHLNGSSTGKTAQVTTTAGSATPVIFNGSANVKVNSTAVDTYKITEIQAPTGYIKNAYTGISLEVHKNSDMKIDYVILKYNNGKQLKVTKTGTRTGIVNLTSNATSDRVSSLNTYNIGVSLNAAGTEITFIWRDQPEGKYQLNIMKKSMKKNNKVMLTDGALAGAKFSIDQYLNGSSSKTSTQVTTEQDKSTAVTFGGSSAIKINDNSKVDKYVIKEIQAPSGYSSWGNYMSDITLEVHKTADMKIDYVELKYSGHTVKVTKGGETQRTKILDINTGKFAGGVSALNTYQLGVVLNEDATQITFVLRNYPENNYQLKIMKKSMNDSSAVNNASSALGGAQFKVEQQINGSGKNTTTNVTTEAGKAMPVTFNGNANVKISDNGYDTYKITEIKSPTGYVMSLKNPISISVNKKRNASGEMKVDHVEVSGLGNTKKITPGKTEMIDIEGNTTQESSNCLVSVTLDGTGTVITVVVKDEAIGGKYNVNLKKINANDNKPVKDVQFRYIKEIGIDLEKPGYPVVSSSADFYTDDLGMIKFPEETITADNVDGIDHYMINELQYMDEEKKAYIPMFEIIEFYVQKRQVGDKYEISGISEDKNGNFTNSITKIAEDLAGNNVNITLKIGEDKTSIDIELPNNPIEKFDFSVQKVSAEDNSLFLKNTKMKIQRSVKKGYTEIKSAETIHEGTFNNDNNEATFTYKENDIDGDCTYYYDVYEESAQQPYKNILGKNIFLRVCVNMDRSGELEAKTEIMGVEGYTPTQSEIEEIKQYIKDPVIDQTARTISLKIENPKDTRTVEVELFKHQLNDKNTPVANAEFSVKKIDEKGNILGNTSTLKTENTNKKIATIENAQLGTTHYYEVTENKVPNNYVGGISAFRVKVEITQEGTVNASITEVKEQNGSEWIDYKDDEHKKYVSLNEPDKNNENIVIYMANSVKYDLTLLKVDYSNNTDLEKADKTTQNAQFKVEQISPTSGTPLLNGELKDGQQTFSFNDAKANTTYKFKITETQVPSGYYENLKNIPIMLTIRTDADGKVMEESLRGSNWEFGQDANLTEEKKNAMSNLIHLKVEDNNQVKLYIANVPNEYYNVQLIKVDKEGNTITSRSATFEVGMTSDKEDGGAKIENQKLSTTNGVLNIASGCLIEKGHTHTYTIKETEAPKGYTKLEGTITATVKFAEESSDLTNKILENEIKIQYDDDGKDDLDESLKEKLQIKLDENTSIPTIKIYIPNDSKLFEFELVKEDMNDQPIKAEVLNNGDIDGAYFRIQRLNFHQAPNTTGTNANSDEFFKGYVINDVLENGKVNEKVPAFTNSQYVYQIEEAESKSEYFNMLERYFINLTITTNEESKIQSADYTVNDKQDHAKDVTGTFKQLYGDYIKVTYTNEKVTITIKNTYGYKVRLNKTDTNGKPIEANIDAYLNAHSENQKYDFNDSNKKCSLNGFYQQGGSGPNHQITGETTHISEDFIIPNEKQTWTIVERNASYPYYNVFSGKAIDVEVEKNNQNEMVVDQSSIIIRDIDTGNELPKEEQDNLKKYIQKIEFIKEGDTWVLNVTLKNPTKYKFKLTKYELDGKTTLSGTTLTVNGEDAISGDKCTYEKEYVSDVRKFLTFEIKETATAKNHINILGENRYVKVTAIMTPNNEVRITNCRVCEKVSTEAETGLEKIIPNTDIVYDYINAYVTTDGYGMYTINVDILNPLQYDFEVEKVDTSPNHKPLQGTGFWVMSPVISEQKGKFNGLPDKENGIKSVDSFGFINGRTIEDGTIKFGERDLQLGKTYEYRIRETNSSKPAVYQNIFYDYNVYVKVKVTETGDITLENYDNGKNYSIRKADRTEAPDSYYGLVSVNIDNSGDKPCIKVQIQNPVVFRLVLNKKVFGNEDINLANTKFEVTSPISETHELTTGSDGNIVIDEKNVKEGIYEYTIKEKEVPGDDVVNILSDNYIKFRLFVKADGTMYTVDESGERKDNTYYLYNVQDEKIDFDDTNIDDFVEIDTTKKSGGDLNTVRIYITDPQKYDLKLLKKDIDTQEPMNDVKFDISVYEVGEKDKEIKFKDANTMEEMNLTGLKTANVDGQDGIIEIKDILFEKSGTYKLVLHESPVDAYAETDDIEVLFDVEVVNGKYAITNVHTDSTTIFVDQDNTKLIQEEGKDTVKVQVGVDNQKIKGSYNLTINKKDLRNKDLDGAKFKVSIIKDGEESELYSAEDEETVVIPAELEIENGTLTISNINIEDVENYTIKIEEIEAPDKYLKLESPIEIKVTTKIDGEGVDSKYVIESAVLSNGNQGGLIELNSSEDSMELTIKDTQFDLALRKYITQIITNEGQENEKVKDITDREPVPNTYNLIHGTETTAEYDHTKQPISVYAKDTIIYTLRVYNEGDVDGYAEEVTDHLPEYLEFVDDEFNASYGWKLDETDASGRTVKTNYLSKATGESAQRDNLIKKFDMEKGELDYKELKIKCKVKENAQAKQKITNIAQISKFCDKNGNDVIDRDSEANNVVLPNDSDLPSYRDTEIERGDSYIPGQQDDDDFEKVLIEEFDLALRKFITGVTYGDGSKEEVTSRIPVFKVDENGKYVYEHTKDPVLVAYQNVVEYTIRVYNEGTVDGYAKEIKDDIPYGLEFLPDDELNKEYRWVMLDEAGNKTDDASKAKYIVTDYLSKENEETDGDNLLLAFDKDAYDEGTITEPEHKEVKVAFKVTIPNSSDKIITNQAQISDDSDSEGDDVTDIDSTPNVWNDGEDDQDIENIRVHYFDLALRKYITQIIENEGQENQVVTDITDREPIPNVEALKAGTDTTATYNHTKEPIKVMVGDTIIYTLRVYNEGDISGYADEIIDHLPEYLDFVDDEFNASYGWELEKYDETGRTVKTSYLAKASEVEGTSNLINAFNKETGELDYKELKIKCKVNDKVQSKVKITNIAEITADSDENGNDVVDRDSEEGNVILPNDADLPYYRDTEIERGDSYIPGQQDDDDFEKVLVERIFDLALRKWVTKAIVIENGKETVHETGHKAEDDPEEIVKVDLKKNKLEDVVVKFEYQIRVTNQGEVAGSVEEISDYIPQGLKFVASDNPQWTEVDGKVVTSQLSGHILQPGESEEVTIVLTWINGKNNLGLKVNVAEISKDYNDYGIPDIDSTPDNYVWGEDDIDDAPVMLTVATGETVKYIGLALIVLAILAGGTLGVKKFVIK